MATDDKLTAEEIADVKSRRKATAAAKAADEAVAKAREDELASQEAVRKAIFDATHDKDGDPIPLVAREG
jgi:hypothetical protein